MAVAILTEVAQRTGAILCSFRADAELRGKWVQEALVDQGGWGGQLLFGGVPGDGRGGMDGTGGQQQLRDLGCLPGTTEGKTFRAAASHLAPAHRGEAVLSADARTTCGW